MKKINLLILASILFAFTLTVNAQKSQGKLILIETSLGNIKIKLYDETPKHRDNFIKLVTERYFDSVLFHRVIKDFMIQTGDPNSKKADKNASLGSGGPGYTIPAEFNPKFYHKKGALAAARSGDEVNPKKESSGSQFYIVQGKKYTTEELTNMENGMNSQKMNGKIREYLFAKENEAMRNELISCQNQGNQQRFDSLITAVTKIVQSQNTSEPQFKFSDQQKKDYTTVGGTPFLDANYTVFGEVIEGLDIVDKIAAVKTAAQDRPEVDVRIIKVSFVKK